MPLAGHSKCRAAANGASFSTSPMDFALTGEPIRGAAARPAAIVLESKPIPRIEMDYQPRDSCSVTACRSRTSEQVSQSASSTLLYFASNGLRRSGAVDEL